MKTNHIVSGFTFHTVSPYFPPRTVTYRNSDAGKVFLEMIHEEKKRILKEWEDSGCKKIEMNSKELIEQQSNIMSQRWDIMIEK